MLTITFNINFVEQTSVFRLRKLTFTRGIVGSGERDDDSFSDWGWTWGTTGDKLLPVSSAAIFLMWKWTGAGVQSNTLGNSVRDNIADTFVLNGEFMASVMRAYFSILHKAFTGSDISTIVQTDAQEAPGKMSMVQSCSLNRPRAEVSRAPPKWLTFCVKAMVPRYLTHQYSRCP